VTLLTNTNHIIRLPVKTVALWGKDGGGDRLLQLKRDQKVILVMLLSSASDSLNPE
jgi:hypothetical protein